MLIACASKRPTAAGPSLLPHGAPDWVYRGGGPCDEGGRGFCGVGAVQGVRNVALARDAAAARARADLAASVRTFIDQLLQDYQASVTDIARRAAAEEQVLRQAAEHYTNATVSGVQIARFWADEQGGVLYCLAKLDFEAAREQLGQLRELNEEARRYIEQNADQMFEKLKQRRGGETPRE